MKTGSLPPTVIICPGNGCNNIRQSNWYGQLYKELAERKIPCVCENFPDPLNARRDRWIPFIRTLVEKHAVDNDVILVGHSSGAQAALRYTELYPVTASVLVSATYTDLGDASERASGYYPQPTSNGGGETNPYQFDRMKTNCPTWHQFHSNNDPFIPLHEAERIRDGLGLSDEDDTYHMLPGRSHFFDFSPELLYVVLDLCE
jgi:predicted alpha/beta hydrolase family esterase